MMSDIALASLVLLSWIMKKHHSEMKIPRIESITDIVLCGTGADDLSAEC